MAHDYEVPLRDQLFLLPPSIADWVPEDHLVWFVLDVVAVVDLSGFHARHPNDGAGRRAYDPEMMLALLVYAYCRGLRSSRRIEAACRSDLAFRAICAQVVPDHIAVARFRAQHQEAIRAVLVDVLELCAKAGLATLGTIAVDGTKIAADAALDVNRSESAITAEVDRILAQAGQADESEAAAPDLHGELPPRGRAHSRRWSTGCAPRRGRPPKASGPAPSSRSSAKPRRTVASAASCAGPRRSRERVGPRVRDRQHPEALQPRPRSRPRRHDLAGRVAPPSRAGVGRLPTLPDREGVSSRRDRPPPFRPCPATVAGRGSTRQSHIACARRPFLRLSTEPEASLHLD